MKMVILRAALTATVRQGNASPIKTTKLIKRFLRKTIFVFSFIGMASFLFAQTQIGSDIDGEAAGDESGRSISLSVDGARVAIGASRNDGNGNLSGHVQRI